MELQESFFFFINTLCLKMSINTLKWLQKNVNDKISNGNIINKLIGLIKTNNIGQPYYLLPDDEDLFVVTS